MPQVALVQKPEDHERLFVARYARLWRYALRLASAPSVADDLAQEAYVRFVLAKPDLSQISNVDSYLSTLVRNVYLSRVRRASQRYERPLDPLEYDSAELAATHTDPHAWLQARDQLRAACAYGCERRLSAKPGSVFLLRFFHALAPSEIARVAHAAHRTVDEWVRVGRQEVRQYLVDPSRLGFVAAVRPGSVRLPAKADTASASSDIVTELRAEIFSHRHAHCFSGEAMAALYSGDEPVPTGTLAEIVVCPVCLDRALGHHRLPPISERSPLDSGREPNRSKGPSLGAHVQRYGASHRAEHHPRVLLVAVNGFIVGREHVSGERSDVAISVPLSEPVAFIEILSEQGVCLLSLVVEAPPVGDVRQRASAELSEGRSVEIEISFEHAWPTVRAAYVLPEPSDVRQPGAALLPEPPTSHVQPFASLPARWWGRAKSWLGTVRETLGAGAGDERRLRPVYGLAFVLLMALAGYALFETLQPTATAAEVLRNATESERRWVSTPGQVAHRVVRLQERVVGTTAIRSERRIETWYEPSSVKAMRVYDDTGRLLAGEWQRPDGSRTVYRTGGAAPAQATPQDASTITGEDIWRQDVTAENFAALVGDKVSLMLEEGESQTLLHAPSVSSGLVSATLVVSPDTHRPIGQLLVVRVGETSLEYRFEEAQAEHVPTANVPRDRFEPDAEFLPKPAAAAATTPAPSLRIAASPLDGLELRATWRLHRLGQCLAVPGRIERGAVRGMRIDVIATAESCRDEVTSALSAIGAEAGVVLNVGVLPPGTRVESSGSDHPTLADSDLPRLPLYPLLSEHYTRLAALGAGDTAVQTDVDTRVRQTVHWARGQSTELLGRARALRQLNGRWTRTSLERLDADSLNVWQELVRDHVVALAAGADLLRRQLEPALLPTVQTPDDASQPPLRGIAAARAEIDRLCRLVEVTEQQVQEWLRPAASADTDTGQVFQASDAALRDVQATARRFGESWRLDP